METITIRLARENEREAIARCIAEGFERDFSLFSKDIGKVTAALTPGVNPKCFYVAAYSRELIAVTGVSDCTGRAVYTNGKAFAVGMSLRSC